MQAQLAIEQSQQALMHLNNEQESGEAATSAYRQQAKNLDATATALRSMIQESRDNINLMQRDITTLPASGKDAQALQAEKAALETEHDGLVAEYRRLLSVVDTIPARDRPVVSATLP
jgi:hypothetical protein